MLLERRRTEESHLGEEHENDPVAQWGKPWEVWLHHEDKHLWRRGECGEDAPMLLFLLSFLYTKQIPPLMLSFVFS